MVRRVAWVVRSAAVSVTAFLAALACAGTELARAESGRTDLLTRYDAWVLLAVAAALAVSVALWWRDRHPAAVAVGAGLTGVLLPVGAVAGLLALPAVLRRGTRRQAAAGVVAVVAASAAWAWRDLRGPTPDSSLVRTLLAPSAATQAPTDVAPAGVVVLLALPLGLAVAVGLYLRARGDAEDSRRTAQRERATRGALDERLARQAERERIAREVHDALGHRLSLLSLHAGGLEVAAGDDARLRESAALVRRCAQDAMTDLRSLLAVLRDPGADEAASGGPRAPQPSLADLARVVDETAAAGAPVISTVYLSDAERADPTLSRAVYRIVQELLTNASRHAPGIPLRLAVQGGPGRGVHIEAANRLRPDGARAGSPGSGQGLVGVSERVAVLGGRVRHGVDDQGAFRVSVWLPWPAEPTGELTGEDTGAGTAADRDRLVGAGA